MLLVEYPQRRQEDQRHHSEQDKPCIGETVERQLYIHAIETRNECSRHEQHAYHGEYLHDAVLVEVDQTKDRILQVLKPFEVEIGVVDKRGDVLEQDIEPGLERGGIPLALEEV